MHLVIGPSTAIAYFLMGNPLELLRSPAKGPLGNTATTSSEPDVTVSGTRTECEHSRPQWNPDKA